MNYLNFELNYFEEIVVDLIGYFFYVFFSSSNYFFCKFFRTANSLTLNLFSGF